MTKREEIAAMLLQGMITRNSFQGASPAEAVKLADELIEELDKKFLPKAPEIIDTHG